MHLLKVEFLWSKLTKAGAIYKGEHSGWYCTSEEAFYPESRLVKKLCPTSGKELRFTADSFKPVEWVTETNYKFRLNDYLGQVQDWLTKQSPIAPSSRLHDLREIFAEGLPDLSISRSRATNPWGIPVPGDPSQTVYVWLDALANYLDLSEMTVPDVHVIGKDILKFHAVYWPAFLIAAGLPLPKTILTHGHWICGREKMSKSLGNVIDPVAEMNRFGLDAFRYLLLRLGRVDADSEYAAETLTKVYELELRNTMANLISRLANPIFYNSATASFDSTPVGPEAIESVESLKDQVAKAYDDHRFYLGLEHVFAHFNQLNSKINEAKPWNLAKDRDFDALEKIMPAMLYSLFNGLSLLKPIMPPYIENLSRGLKTEPGSNFDIRRYIQNAKGARISPLE